MSACEECIKTPYNWNCNKGIGRGHRVSPAGLPIEQCCGVLG